MHKSYHLGALIEHERRKQNISQKQLSEGLCSGETISTFEGGFTEVDYYTTILLLQRLGKSPDKLEYIMSSDEYKKMRMRDIIYWLIEKSAYVKAEEVLHQYIIMCKKRNKALDMFIYRTRSYIEMKRGHTI
ncbi:MAG: hypothetical protein IJV71_11510, partial [Lachnospiraceae bacterium]|nr:hypothetical protein [Lachnospiraceae bacterium]